MSELLELAIKNSGLKNFNQIATELKIRNGMVSKWAAGSSKPNGIHTLKLVKMAKLSPDEAIKIIEGGYAQMSILLLTALLSTLALASMYAIQYCILCKINGKLIFNRINDLKQNYTLLAV